MLVNISSHAGCRQLHYCRPGLNQHLYGWRNRAKQQTRCLDHSSSDRVAMALTPRALSHN